GPHAGTKVGDEAVLIGSQAGETITADDMAAAAETISYEITSGLTARVDRYWINASQ
ncbi:MAG: alanine racemase C-terminal domain-containing protein, partial [Cutibacterium sp.]|nr:alanine racemase C-terminal domain-containing protein [Cutibacterium sp.]